MSYVHLHRTRLLETELDDLCHHATRAWARVIRKVYLANQSWISQASSTGSLVDFITLPTCTKPVRLS